MKAPPSEAPRQHQHGWEPPTFDASHRGGAAAQVSPARQKYAQVAALAQPGLEPYVGQVLAERTAVYADAMAAFAASEADQDVYAFLLGGLEHHFLHHVGDPSLRAIHYRLLALEGAGADRVKADLGAIWARIGADADAPLETSLGGYMTLAAREAGPTDREQREVAVARKDPNAGHVDALARIAPDDLAVELVRLHQSDPAAYATRMRAVRAELGNDLGLMAPLCDAVADVTGEGATHVRIDVAKAISSDLIQNFFDRVIGNGEEQPDGATRKVAGPFARLVLAPDVFAEMVDAQSRQYRQLLQRVVDDTLTPGGLAAAEAPLAELVKGLIRDAVEEVRAIDPLEPQLETFADFAKVALVGQLVGEFLAAVEVTRDQGVLGMARMLLRVAKDASNLADNPVGEVAFEAAADLLDMVAGDDVDEVVKALEHDLLAVVGRLVARSARSTDPSRRRLIADGFVKTVRLPLENTYDHAVAGGVIR